MYKESHFGGLVHKFNFTLPVKHFALSLILRDNMPLNYDLM
jgi:hypothetical protein